MLMHYVFDDWMSREHPNIPFERYADDAVVHCRSEKQAGFIRDKIDQRLRRCKLELHPEKTRIVYCKDELRALSHQHTSFDFLGYTFRPRTNRTRHGKLFVNFSPAISDKAKKRSDNVSENGRFICGVGRPWLRLRGRSIPLSGVGSYTMDGLYARK